MRTFYECSFCEELYAEELEVIRVVRVEKELFSTTDAVKRYEMKSACSDCKGRNGLGEPDA